MFFQYSHFSVLAFLGHNFSPHLTSFWSLLASIWRWLASSCLPLGSVGDIFGALWAALGWFWELLCPCFSQFLCLWVPILKIWALKTLPHQPLELKIQDFSDILACFFLPTFKGASLQTGVRRSARSDWIKKTSNGSKSMKFSSLDLAIAPNQR